MDTRAVIEAIKSRRIGQLGIDVYEFENDLFFADWCVKKTNINRHRCHQSLFVCFHS